MEIEQIIKKYEVEVKIVALQDDYPVNGAYEEGVLKKDIYGPYVKEEHARESIPLLKEFYKKQSYKPCKENMHENGLAEMVESGSIPKYLVFNVLKKDL